MKYTVKDVRKIMKVSRETLRYYENMKLLSPEVDTTNQYRYYDDWDINYIGECKRYRALGFNVQEIREIFQEDDLMGFTKKMEEKQKYYLEQIEFYQMLSRQNSEYIEKLKSIPSALHVCSLVQTEERYFIPNRKNFDYSCSLEQQSDLHKMMDHFAFIEATVVVEQQEYKQKEETFSWGFSVKKELAESLGIKYDNMMVLPCKKAVHTIVDAGERWNFSYALLEPLQAFATKENLNLEGAIYGNLLTRINEDGRLHRYIEVFYPVSAIHADVG